MSKILSSELIPKVMDKINSREIVAVVATVDKRGIPNTAPISFIHAKDNKTLKMLIYKEHETSKNIEANGKVCISIMDEGNTAVSIKGVAKIIGNSTIDPNFNIIQVEIASIKSDRTIYGDVIQGARLKLNEKLESAFHKAFDELE